MSDLFTVILVFILGIIAVAIAGLIAGLSPTLYIAQTTTSSKPEIAKRFTLALTSGVLIATVILLILFQTFSLSSLLDIINSTTRALFVSVIFNFLVGTLFIFGGLRYIRTQDNNKAYQADANKVEEYKGFNATFRLGFIKTFLSISSATAIFIGGNIIASATNTISEQSIFTGVFLIATLTPFVTVIYFLQRKPELLHSIVNRVKGRLSEVNYRHNVGMAAILFGGAIVIFNAMMALFY